MRIQRMSGVWIEGEKIKLETVMSSSILIQNGEEENCVFVVLLLLLMSLFFPTLSSLLQTSYPAHILFPWRGQLMNPEVLVLSEIFAF